MSAIIIKLFRAYQTNKLISPIDDNPRENCIVVHLFDFAKTLDMVQAKPSKINIFRHVNRTT